MNKYLTLMLLIVLISSCDTRTEDEKDRHDRFKNVADDFEKGHSPTEYYLPKIDPIVERIDFERVGMMGMKSHVYAIDYSSGGMNYKILIDGPQQERMKIINLTKDSLEVALLKKELQK